MVPLKRGCLSGKLENGQTDSATAGELGKSVLERSQCNLGCLGVDERFGTYPAATADSGWSGAVCAGGSGGTLDRPVMRRGEG